MGLRTRLRAKARALWIAAKEERATPREIAVAVALGVVAGSTPAVGLHTAVALGLATAFRKNRLFCWLGSRVANAFTLPFIALASVQLAHCVRTGTWVDVDRAHVLDRLPELVLDWALGCIPVGGSLGVMMGALAYLWARRRDRRRAATAESESEDAEPTEGP